MLTVKLFSKKGNFYRPWNAEEKFRVINTSNARDGYRYTYSCEGLKWVQLDQGTVDKILARAGSLLCPKYSVLTAAYVEVEEENDNHTVVIIANTVCSDPNSVEYKTWKFPLKELTLI